MFFGYNVGSTLHKVITSDINLFYGITHTLTDNFISNLLDQDRHSIFVETSSGTRPENFVTIKKPSEPPVFLDTWIGSYKDSKTLAFMHIPGIINIPTAHAIDQNQRLKSAVHICYDEQTLEYLNNLGVSCQLIQPAILPSFIQTNVDISDKSIDIGILQNSYESDRLESILQTMKTSLPNLNIQIFQDNQTNEYLDEKLKQTKIVVTLDPVSPIDITYATNFCNVIICTNLPSNELPNRVYTAKNLEILLEKSNKILTEYDKLFNTLSTEKNRLLLNNNFDKSRELMNSLLEYLSEKTAL
jgi:hypothetical protein